MEFRLIYEGTLPAQSGSNAHLREKHTIRKEIDKQLKALWYVQAPLVGFATYKYSQGDPVTGYHEWTQLDEIVRKYSRFGFNFVPLIGRHLDLCAAWIFCFFDAKNPDP